MSEIRRVGATILKLINTIAELNLIQRWATRSSNVNLRLDASASASLNIIELQIFLE